MASPTTYTLHVYSRGDGLFTYDEWEFTLHNIESWSSLMWQVGNYGLSDVELMPHSMTEYKSYLPDGFVPTHPMATV